MKIERRRSMWGLLMTVMAAGCSGAPATDSGSEVASESSPLSMTGREFVGDDEAPFRCQYGLSCCKPTEVLIGVHQDLDVVMCAWGQFNLESCTFRYKSSWSRQGIPACRTGEALVGIDMVTGDMECCHIFDVAAERKDGPGQLHFGQATFTKNGQTHSLHKCDDEGPGYFMTGASLSGSNANTFLCAQ